MRGVFGWFQQPGHTESHLRCPGDVGTGGFLLSTSDRHTKKSMNYYSKDVCFCKHWALEDLKAWWFVGRFHRPLHRLLHSRKLGKLRKRFLCQANWTVSKRNLKLRDHQLISVAPLWRECKARRGLKTMAMGWDIPYCKELSTGIVGLPRFIVSTWQILCKKCGVNQSFLGLT